MLTVQDYGSNNPDSAWSWCQIILGLNIAKYDRKKMYRSTCIKTIIHAARVLILFLYYNNQLSDYYFSIFLEFNTTYGYAIYVKLFASSWWPLH